ncbi:MAG: FAD-dependent oxidoreductase [Acidiferrobacterales bacterium]|nr:FAD-dependent oxidoreductase [Acidiferrobacterales bacterium]
MSNAALPGHRRIVIIGGGIIGSSTAYHLAQLGETDCIVLEQGKLTNGSTWHAAGLVGQLRNNANVTQLLNYSVELYDRLEQETGQATGWKMNGGLRLACNSDRVTEIKRQITMARSFGLEMHFLTPQEVLDLCPVINIDDLAGAAYLPTDGQVNPADLTQALAKGARSKGIRFYEDCGVTAITTTNGRVNGLDTSHGHIDCEIIVNCAGMWSRSIGKMAGVNVPIVPMKHHYIVTGKVQGVRTGMPTIRDPDRLIYFKEDVGGLVFGGYELNPKRWEVSQPPDDFYFTLLDFEIDHFEPLMEAGLNRIPAMGDADTKQMICGPESFTPDGNFILGESPQVKNFFIGTGFNAFGIASAGGAGKALAQWISAGAPPMDLGQVDIRRFGKVHQSDDWIASRTVELCSKHYTMGWPHEEHTSARPRYRSVLYDALRDFNASFGEKLGWERPNWFAPDGMEPIDSPSFGRANWFEYVGLEHRAVREKVGVIDQSSFAKFMLEGNHAAMALESICSSRIDRPVGSVIYTQMLNPAGGIECDVTVTRLQENRFIIVAGTGYASHHFYHIKNKIPTSLTEVSLTEVTEQYSTLSLSGPNSRLLLQTITEQDMSASAFPFLTSQIIEIAGSHLIAIRVSFAGELGWELHVPVDDTLKVFQDLIDAGKDYELTHVGYRALESLRLEKGFRSLGADIGPDFTPLEAGMRKLVKLRSGLPFVGREALVRQSNDVLQRRLACFTTQDPDLSLLGRETIYRNGIRVGWTTSAGWGYTVNKNIAYGYVRHEDGVPDEFLYDGTYELEVEEVRIPVEVEAESLYDPTSSRMRA